MATKKNIKSKQQFEEALALEKAGNLDDAIKLYQKSTGNDPTNVRAWNRLMILYRKLKAITEEIKLIKTAITELQRANELQQQAWLNENKEKAESTRELAKALGLLQQNGLPLSDDTTIEKWKTRLYLLEYKQKNARKKTKGLRTKNRGSKKSV